MISFSARGLSMDPLIKEGDRILAQPVERQNINLGDILVFKTADSPVTAAHRLIGVNKSKQSLSYILGGDFSDDASDTVNYEDIVAKAVAIERAGRFIDINTAYTRALKFIWNIFPLSGKVILILLKWRSICFKINILIGPRFFIKSPEQSLLTLKEKFNQIEEVNFYSEYVKQGLQDWEEAAVKDYCKKGGHILNVGCSAGREAIALAKLGFKVTAVDISEGMIAQAGKNAQSHSVDIKFEVMSASEIDFPEGSFDCCLLSQNVYSFIPSRALRIESLRRIKKCLKPQGTIFVHPYVIENKFFSGSNIIDAARGLRNLILPSFFSSQPGDAWMRGVSPASRMDKFCFCHFFRSEREVLSELEDSGLKSLNSKIDNIFIAQAWDDQTQAGR